MLFSVLIPVYNTSKYLDECINSVLSQTEKDFEIVLLNDGSTDNSGDICDSYAEKYPDFIRVIHKENEGLMMTRRRGFKEAKGDYFFCLDSDDYLCDNDAFKKIKKLIVEKHCDLVVYNYLMEKETPDNNKEIVLFDLPDGYVFEGKKKNVLYRKILIGGYFNCLVIKVPKNSIVDIDTDYSQMNKTLIKSQGEDLLQSFPILNNAKKIGYINQCLYFYRWNNQSISRNLRPEFFKAYKTLYDKTKEYINIWEMDDKVLDEVKNNHLRTVISIIICSYNICDDINYWYEFVLEVQKDDYYRDINSTEHKKKLSKYYRMCNFLLNHKMKKLLGILIKNVSKRKSK